MKIGILFSFAVIVFSVITSQKSFGEEVFADSEIGDIVYSYLDADAFIQKHSKDWMRLTSNTNISGTELCRQLTSKNPQFSCQLPNFDGVFFRTVSANYSLGNYYNQTTAAPQNPLKYSITGGDHSHSSSVGPGYDCGSANSNLFATTWGNGYTYSKSTQSAGHSHDISLSSGWDAETRPVNIALYAYIRVNNVHSSKKVLEDVLERLKKAEKELALLKRRKCNEEKGIENKITCYQSLVNDFYSGNYYLGDGEILSLVKELQKIVCTFNSKLSKNQGELFEKFLNRYNSGEIYCK